MFLGISPHGDLFFTSNFHIVPIPAWSFLVVPQAWSLGVEITFYLLAPLLVRKSVPFQVGLIVASIAARLFFRLYFKLYDDPWSYRFFPFELSFFLIGSIAYRSYALHRMLYETIASRFGWTRWLFFLFLLSYTPIFGESNRGLQVFIPLSLALPFFFVATKSSSFDKFCGELSYPLYLSHNFALSVMHHLVAFVPVWLHGVFFSLGAMAVAYPITRWVDYPVEKFRHSLVRYRRQQEASA
jgi:peptidoglycan/LPS O-acetylase OafA/YrhL